MATRTFGRDGPAPGLLNVRWDFYAINGEDVPLDEQPDIVERPAGSRHYEYTVELFAGERMAGRIDYDGESMEGVQHAEADWVNNAGIAAVKERTDRLPDVPASAGNVSAVGSAVTALGVALTNGLAALPLAVWNVLLASIVLADSAGLAFKAFLASYVAPGTQLTTIEAKVDAVGLDAAEARKLQGNTVRVNRETGLAEVLDDDDETVIAQLSFEETDELQTRTRIREE